ncbi:hypothetical protein EVAR_87255_1 [Eumeta japonica]|uniref:Uncharacterized protein n=1 Tax=Eumeta variegata TaxID=151549 RepID=A0A4C1YL60_EUMVA|nr:hypothetical protein EVAR_87255_1 [Eumeta japonica]
MYEGRLISPRPEALNERKARSARRAGRGPALGPAVCVMRSRNSAPRKSQITTLQTSSDSSFEALSRSRRGAGGADVSRPPPPRRLRPLSTCERKRPINPSADVGRRATSKPLARYGGRAVSYNLAVNRGPGRTINSHARRIPMDGVPQPSRSRRTTASFQ